MKLKPLTEPILRRLSTEALVSFLGQSDKFEAVLQPGCDIVLCNEPVADLNCVVAGRGAADGGRFERAVRTCLSRDLPFLAMIFPEAGDRVAELAAEAGLAHAADFPFMVRDDAPVDIEGDHVVTIRRASGEEGALGCGQVLCSAFGMPEDSTRRVMTASVMDSPGLDCFLAMSAGRAVGSVTLTHHGDTSGIWAMGTDPDQQGRGIGRRLLSTAMAEIRKQSARRFFLGATPAGYRLYESLGFTTRFTAQVWASGETGQA